MKDGSVAKPKKIVLGQIGKVHGIKGWLKLNSFTSPPANILNYQRFSVRVEEQTDLLEIDEFSKQPNGLLVHFSGYDDPDSSKKLVGQQLSVESACLPELQNNDFYWHELENLEVVNQDGHNLGKVAYLIETGANDVLVVQPTTVSLDGRERLIPYVKGSVIKNVDLAQKTIQIDWSAELLE
tara:strand:+ start:62 stop:607 length:546 start_codon:yes stop_codon:yes gene_type:complete